MEFIQKRINEFGADDFFSLKEWNYLHNEDPKESEKISYSWQYENLYVMEWALGLIDGPLDFPDHFCAVAEAAQLLTAFHSMREILEAAKPRSAKELLDACDMIFCLDWACTDTRMRDLPAPAGMDGGVVFERHKALNWLVGAGEKADWTMCRWIREEIKHSNKTHHGEIYGVFFNCIYNCSAGLRTCCADRKIT